LQGRDRVTARRHARGAACNRPRSSARTK
jgi:hypothetical protein